jgi:hypothetical protein
MTALDIDARREGYKAMEKSLTSAERVRRAFKAGRPPRPLADGEVPQPLHPTVAWQRANDALSAFRARMTAAKLNSRHAEAVIIFVERATPDQPHFLFLEEEGKTPEEMRKAAFERLIREDVITLGMIFGQFDEQTKQKAIFPYLFFGLNQRGMAVLRKAAELQQEAAILLKSVN